MLSSDFIDTVLIVETPEAAEIELRPAGVWVRARAFLLDFVFRIILVLAVIFSLDQLSRFAFGLSLSVFFISAFLIYWLYPVLFETFWYGQTPAKKIFRLRVVQDNGTPISFAQSLIRNLMRTADILPFAYGLGMSCMLMHPQFKRLGDILSGSLVVYVDEPQVKINKSVLATVTAVPPPVALSCEERLAMILLIERLPQLSTARQQELANELLHHTSIAESERIATIQSWTKFLLTGSRGVLK